MGFPFAKLAPLPWKVRGSGIYCANAEGGKVAATKEGHAFPDRGKNESEAIAREIVIAMNCHGDLMDALKAILNEEVFHVAVNQVEIAPDRLRGIIGEIYEIARVGVAKAEAR